MLAAYLTWHLRRALAPLTYTDEHPPARDNPVTAATRSASAVRKAARHTNQDNHPVHSFRGLLDHLATLTRNTITLAGHTFDKITNPTATQRQAFDLRPDPGHPHPEIDTTTTAAHGESPAEQDIHPPKITKLQTKPAPSPHRPSPQQADQGPARSQRTGPFHNDFVDITKDAIIARSAPINKTAD